MPKSTDIPVYYLDPNDVIQIAEPPTGAEGASMPTLNEDLPILFAGAVLNPRLDVADRVDPERVYRLGATEEKEDCSTLSFFEERRGAERLAVEVATAIDKDSLANGLSNNTLSKVSSGIRYRLDAMLETLGAPGLQPCITERFSDDPVTRRAISEFMNDIPEDSSAIFSLSEKSDGLGGPRLLSVKARRANTSETGLTRKIQSLVAEMTKGAHEGL